MDNDEAFGRTRDAIRHGWESVAYEYSKDRSRIFAKSAARLVDLLRPPERSSVVDVGCGNGAVTLRTSNIVGSEGLVLGSDIAMSMLQLGQAEASRKNLPASFSQMDAEQLGLATNSFDLVTCAFALFQFPNLEFALREMWRVLKPGGRLGLSNWGTGYFSPIASMQRDLFRKFGIKPLLTNPLTFEPHKLKGILDQTGFSNVRNYAEKEEILFATPEDVWAYNMDMGPFPIMLASQLTVERQQDLFDQFTVMLGDQKTERGIKSTFHLLYTTAEKGS